MASPLGLGRSPHRDEARREARGQRSTELPPARAARAPSARAARRASGGWHWGQPHQDAGWIRRSAARIDGRERGRQRAVAQLRDREGVARRGTTSNGFAHDRGGRWADWRGGADWAGQQWPGDGRGPSLARAWLGGRTEAGRGGRALLRRWPRSRDVDFKRARSRPWAAAGVYQCDPPRGGPGLCSGCVFVCCLA